MFIRSILKYSPPSVLDNFVQALSKWTAMNEIIRLYEQGTAVTAAAAAAAAEVGGGPRRTVAFKLA